MALPVLKQLSGWVKHSRLDLLHPMSLIRDPMLVTEGLGLVLERSPFRLDAYRKPPNNYVGKLTSYWGGINTNEAV